MSVNHFTLRTGKPETKEQGLFSVDNEALDRFHADPRCASLMGYRLTAFARGVG